MNFRTIVPIFLSAASVLLTLTFGILQITGAHPFTEKNVTLGWVYISISMTVAAFFGMYIGFGLIYLFDQIFGTKDPIIESSSRRNSVELYERDLSERYEVDDGYEVDEERQQPNKKVKFDFNHVVII